VAAAVVGALLAPVGPAQPAAAAALGRADRVSWAYTDLRQPFDIHIDPEGDLPVGAWRDDENDLHLSRAYFTFDLTQFHGAEIHDASVAVREAQATNCADRVLEVWTTDAVTSSTSFLHPPHKRGLLEPRFGHEATPCPAPVLSWHATEALRQAVAAGEPTLTVEVRVPGWHQLRLDLGRRLSDAAWLSVQFNHPPDAPMALAVEGLECADEPYPAVRPTTPTLQALVTDPNRDRLDVTFSIWPVDQPEQTTEFLVDFVPSDFNASLRLPDGLLADQGDYAWRARSTDADGAVSGWSATCRFSVDATPPQDPPGVSSPDYPADVWSFGAGRPGTFVFDANGVPDVVRYMYDWNSGPTFEVDADTPGGSVTLALAPPTEFSVLTVRSLDRAGNVSSPRSYSVLATPTGPTLTWDADQVVADVPFPVTFTPAASVPVAEHRYWLYRFGDALGEPVAVAPEADGTAVVPVTVPGPGPDVWVLEARTSTTEGWTSSASRFIVFIP
jgi:hypothetical protein